jgi:hypothetical protein
LCDFRIQKPKPLILNSSKKCTFPNNWNIEIREYGMETSRMVSDARGTERSQPTACINSNKGGQNEGNSKTKEIE